MAEQDHHGAAAVHVSFNISLHRSSQPGKRLRCIPSLNRHEFAVHQQRVRGI